MRIDEDSKEEEHSVYVSKADFTLPSQDVSEIINSVNWVIPSPIHKSGQSIVCYASEDAFAFATSLIEDCDDVNVPTTSHCLEDKVEEDLVDTVQEGKENDKEDDIEEDEEVRELQKKFTSSIVRSTHTTSLNHILHLPASLSHIFHLPASIL